MDNFFTGLCNIFTGSDISTDVGGRLYAEEVPDNATFPYVRYIMVSGMPEDTFKDKIDDYLVQFSLYSASKSMSEITTMYNHLIDLLDDAAITISGDTLIWCKRVGVAPVLLETIITESGEQVIKHWPVEYSIKVQD